MVTTVNLVTANFNLYENADWQIPFEFTDYGPGVPEDLTGSTFEMHIKDAAGEDAAELELTTANGGIASTDLSNGLITVVIADGALATGEYVHDLVQIVTATGQRILRWRGTLNMLQGVAQP